MAMMDQKWLKVRRTASIRAQKTRKRMRLARESATLLSAASPAAGPEATRLCPQIVDTPPVPLSRQSADANRRRP